MARQQASSAHIARLDQGLAQSRQTAIRNEYIPRLTATSELRYNALIGVQALPAAALGQSGDNPIITRVGTTWNTTAGLQLDQLVWDPTRKHRLDASTASLDKANWSTRSAEESSVYLACSAYLNVLQADAQLDFAAADVKRWQQTKTDLELAQSLGRALSTDVNQAQLELLEAEIHLNQLAQTRLTTRATLLSTLGKASEDVAAVQLSDSLPGLLYANAQGGSALSNSSAEAFVAQQAEEASNEKAEKRAILPKIKLIGYAGGQNLGQELTLTNDKQWFGNSYVGLQVNVPLVDGKQRSARAEQSKLRAQQAAERRQDAEVQRSAEVIRARAALTTADANLPLQQQRVALASENRRLVRERLRSGQATGKTLLDAETDLSIAQTQLVQVQVQLLAARLELARVENRLLTMSQGIAPEIK